MKVYNHQSVSVLTVQQFSEYFFPTLIKRLTDDIGVTLKEAIRIGESVIQKLKDRFKTNKPQPVQVFQKAISIIVVRETNKFKRLMDKNFELSEEVFNQMVAKLQAGDERLFEQVFLKQFKPCLVLLKRKYKASHQDAYDATMNAMLAFCRKLKEGKIEYGNLRFLFTQMATHAYLKWVQRQGKLEEFTQFDLTEDLPRFDKESYEILGKAFAMLGDGCSKLLNAFYYNDNTLQQVAEKTDRSYVAIRKQKQRCIEKLRDFFVKIS